MSRKPDGDGRQQDFFGAPRAELSRAELSRAELSRAELSEPKPAPVRPPKARPPRTSPSKAGPAKEPEQPAPRRAALPPVADEPDASSLHDQVARLSPAEVRELTATLSDDALAQLTLATIRQLKRRLAREGRYGSKGPRTSLGRAAQQLVAELGGQGDDDDDFGA